MSISREDCLDRDREDPLARFRERFHIPEGMIYLDGNSLGALPTATPARLRDLVEVQWGEHLIDGWTADRWMESPRRVGAKMAGLLGAADDEVVIGDSTSVCLFKVLCAALRMRPDRHLILSTTDNFPADLYVAQGVAELLGGRCSLRVVDHEHLLDHLDSDVAVLMLTHVDYRSGYMYDMDALTRAAHAAGALTVWDLSHSAGAVPVDLSGASADFAVGCGYKYLNGGPGAPALVFVAKHHQREARNPISSWLGHANPFDFSLEYTPDLGVGRMISGSPSVLSIAALECGVDIALEAGTTAVRQKSVAQTELFIDLVESRLADAGFTIASPRDWQRRGSQVGLRHADGQGIVEALLGHGVIGDFRTPDICRFGFAPLYVGYADVYDAVDRLAKVVNARLTA